MTNAESEQPLRAQGQRATWDALPERIVAALSEAMGAPIVETQSIASGFSPGVAAQIETSTGERAFVKAVSSNPNPVAPTFHRREILVNRSLPTDSSLPDALPIPRMRWELDEGEGDDRDHWVVLLFDAIDGREPHQPWREPELSRVIAALDLLAERLTPSPVDARAVGLVADGAVFTPNHWRRRDNPEDRARLDPWAARHLDALVALADEAPAAVEGNTLLHVDLRADNMILTDDRVFIVDWPHARVGAAWVDPMFMAPSVAMHGGPDPEDFLMRCASVQGVARHRIDAAVAGMAGFFTSEGMEPIPPGLPGIRAFQEAQGVVARRWLATRMGWD